MKNLRFKCIRGEDNAVIKSDSYVSLEFYFQATGDNNQMQYINIEDKHGEEYCFGDIVNIDGGIGVIVWMDDRIGIGSGEINNYHAIDSIDMYELAKGEIVGNTNLPQTPQS